MRILSYIHLCLSVQYSNAITTLLVRWITFSLVGMHGSRLQGPGASGQVLVPHAGSASHFQPRDSPLEMVLPLDAKAPATRRFTQKNFGFWVWVWVYIPNPKPKTLKFFIPKPIPITKTCLFCLHRMFFQHFRNQMRPKTYDDGR
jgi:hypothetical protein